MRRWMMALLLFVPVSVAGAVRSQAAVPAASFAWGAEAVSASLPAEAFEPDIHPSRRSAVRLLVGKWARRAELGDWIPDAVQVIGTATTPDGLLREVRAELRKSLPSVNCDGSASTAEAGGTVGQRKHVLRVELVQPTAHGARAAVRLRSEEPPAELEAAYVEKPWVEDFAAFASLHGEQRWVIGQSSAACTTPAEASSQAIRSAVEGMWTAVRARARQMRVSWTSADDTLLRATIESELAVNRYVADRFVQQFSRPYGNLWREWILVDMSGQSIAGLAQQLTEAQQARRSALARTVVSVAGLTVAIYGLYLILNAATKGYFTWRLRTTAAILAALGIMVLLWFAARR